VKLRGNRRTPPNIFAREVDKRCVWRYNQELQDDCISRKKGKRAFFDIIDPHQGPDHLDVPPAPVWRLKLPNSLKSGIWSMDEFGSCPAGPGKSSSRQTPKLPAFCDYLPSFRIHDTCARAVGN